MSDSPVHVQFFGDGEHMFSLPPALIIELERLTSSGIGGITRRLFAGEFHHAALLDTVRLALIGGGESPEDAAALVAAYAANRPVMEIYPLVVAILETVMFGKASDEVKLIAQSGEANA